MWRVIGHGEKCPFSKTNGSTLKTSSSVALIVRRFRAGARRRPGGRKDVPRWGGRLFLGGGCALRKFNIDCDGDAANAAAVVKEIRECKHFREELVLSFTVRGGIPGGRGGPRRT